MKKGIIFLLFFVSIIFISAADINVNGWTLYQYGAAHSFTLPDTTIPGGWYMIIARNATQAEFETEWGVLPANVIFINSGDNVPQINGGETFSLYDNTSTLIDTTYHILSSGYSAQRDSNNVNTWTEVVRTSGTPGSGAVGNFGKGIIITEFSDAVTYSYEFVELYNDTGVSSNAAPSINSLNHSPSSVHPDDIVSVIANITDDSGILADSLFVMASSIGVWNNLSNDSISGDNFYYTLGNFNLGDTVQYYVKAVDDSNIISYSDTNSFIVSEKLYLVINEFCNDGPTVDDGSGEWIELYNYGTTSIDISDFIISDGEGSFHIPASTILGAGEFYLCMNTKDSFDVYYTLPVGVGYISYSSIVSGSFLLSNTGDNIDLFNSDSLLIDEVVYGSVGTNPAPDPGDSLSSTRNPDGQDTDVCSDDFIVSSYPSPGKGISGGPSITNISRNIIIPTSSEQLIITCNVTDDDGVNIVKLVTSAYDSTDIDTYDMINTSGDVYSYTLAARGDGCRFEYFIYAVDNVGDTTKANGGNFFWGTTSIPKLKETDSNGYPRYYDYQIRSTGVVTTNTGTYSTSANIINFQENYILGAVIKIDSITTDETVVIGDSIFAEGTIGNWNGQTRIQPPYSKITKISSGHYVDTLYIECADELMDTVGETYEGLLVQIDCHGIKSGIWPGADTSRLLVMYDTVTATKAGIIDTFLMFVDNDTDIDGQIEPSWDERIVGIITQFDVSSPYYSMYELLPRSYTDVTTSIVTSIENTFLSINIENGYANLKWNTSIDNIATYRIEKKNSTEKYYKTIATLDNNVKSYIDYTYLPDHIYEYKLIGITNNGKTIEFNSVFTNQIIKNFSVNIDQNITNNIAWLKLNIPQKDNIHISLVDIQGRLIKEIYKGIFTPGQINQLIDFRALPSGVYFVNIKYKNEISSVKITLMK